jgi:hypothetical protein
MQDLCNTFAKYLHRSLDDLREILGQNPLKVSVNVAENLYVPRSLQNLGYPRSS